MNFNIKCSEIAEHLNVKAEGNTELLINNVNRIAFTGPNELTFLSSEEFLPYLDKLENCAVITFPQLADKVPASCCFIPDSNPHAAFARVLRFIETKNVKPYKGIHPTAVISGSAIVAGDAYVGPYAVIGDETVLEAGAVVMANSVIQDNVRIGSATMIYPNVSIYSNTIIGSNCIIHSGAVIGSDGFGFEEDRATGAFTKIPQLGNVIIEDEAEVGANTTIDRALAGSTILRRGVKVDNLVQIAHNCIIGENTGIAGQAGISGSTTVGARNRFGGQVGIAGHLETGDDVIIIAQSGVSKSLPEKGMYMGAPAKDKRKAFMIEAVMRNLPDIAQEVKRLRQELEELKEGAEKR